MVAGVHLAISSNVLRPGCTACMKISQQNIRRWRPRHTVGMPRHTMVTKPGREVKVISMCRALSRGGGKKKGRGCKGVDPVSYGSPKFIAIDEQPNDQIQKVV